MFSRERPTLRIADVARRLGTARSTAFRLLRTLEVHGFVAFDPVTNEYRLGLAAVRLGRVAVEGLDLRRAALPHMRGLVRETNQTSIVVVPRGNRAVVLETVEGNQLLRFSIDIGDVWPLHAGALMRVLLAHLPEDEQNAILARPLEAYTSTTITDVAELKRNLVELRRCGWAYSDGELAEGVGAFGVPLLVDNTCIGALGIAGPRTAVSIAHKDWIVPLLKYAADALVRELGARCSRGPRP